MAEQLAFQQRLLQGGAVDGHQGPLAARAVVVQGAGDQFLAGAAGAADQHGGVGRRHLLDELHDLLHRPAGADQAIAGRFVGDLLDPLPFPAVELDLLERLLDVDFQLGEMERLGEVVVGAMLHRLDGGLDAAVGGEHDGFELRLTFLELLQELDAVHARHVQVEQGDVAAGRQHLQCFFAGAGRRDVQALLLKALAKRLPQLLVVIDDQQADGGVRGCHGRILAERPGSVRHQSARAIRTSRTCLWHLTQVSVIST